MKGWMIAIFLAVALAESASAAYVVSPGDLHPPSGHPFAPPEVAFWELPFWVILLELCILPLELLGAAKTCLSLGFRRVDRENVLDSTARVGIYTMIRAAPGIHLRALSDRAAMPMSTLRYHLSVLQEHHKITTLDEDGHLRFYENSGTYTAVQQRVLKHLRNSTTREILIGILEHPGASRQEVADTVGISGPAVTWHMKKLTEDRIIRQERVGKAVRYRISEDAAHDLATVIRDAEDPRFSPHA
jgi:predicted transcriptional regulator